MKSNKILCIFPILVFIFVFLTSYQQQQINILNGDYTNLQDHCNELERQNNSLTLTNEELNVIINDMTEDKCSEALTFQSIIEPIKDKDKLTWFILYKSMQEKYSDYIGVSESVYNYFTEDQITMMWKCIETETYQCSFNAKVNVACVILNRIEHDIFPTDPIEIITSPNQFAYGRNNITEDTKLALEYAFMIEDTTDGCIAFRSDCSPNTWLGLTKQFTDESGHTFYK